MNRLFPLLAIALAACSSASNEDEDSVLLDAAQQPLDKAEAVEDKLLEAQEQRQKVLEDSED